MFKIRIFPILVLLFGLTLTIFISFSVYRDNEKIELHGFEAKCREFESEIRMKLNSNSQILYSSASFISSSDTITHHEWKEFQMFNKSLTQTAGIVGIGFSKIIKPESLVKFEQLISAEGFPKFKVKPEGERNFYTAVLFIEPFTGGNISVYGHDGYTNPIRRKAMVWARDSDVAVITDKIVLVQDSLSNTRKASTIMFVPVFKTDKLLNTSSEREALCIGWVFCSFRLSDFFKEILEEWDYKLYGLKVYDESDISERGLLFDSDSEFGIDRKENEKANFSLQMNFNGKIWTLYFTNYDKNLKSLWARVYTTLSMGLIVSLLFFVLAVSLVNSRIRSRRIQQLNEELKKVNDSKDRFISVLAHDLKSPFNSLLGFSEMLVVDLNELNYKEIENYSNQIYGAAKITYQLLDELLLWAQVQSDQFPFNPERINIYNLCSIVAKDFDLIASKKEVIISLDNGVEPIVWADELMVKTVLRNLLTNAIKYSHPGGKVKISGSCDENEAIVTIEDNGIGMTASQVANLFDIRHKSSKEGTAGEKGTGLGLLLCKDMIEKHKGRIWAESEYGKGSKFRFSLQVVR